MLIGATMNPEQASMPHLKIAFMLLPILTRHLYDTVFTTNTSGAVRGVKFIRNRYEV